MFENRSTVYPKLVRKIINPVDPIDKCLTELPVRFKRPYDEFRALNGDVDRFSLVIRKIDVYFCAKITGFVARYPIVVRYVWIGLYIG